MRLLVTGGAGYIGSHMTKLLRQRSCEVVVLDNLSSGSREAVQGEFIFGDIGNVRLLDRLFQERSFDAVIHFAASIQVGESVLHPKNYYQNNVVKTLGLLDTMVAHHIPYFIFSSTAAIYGAPQYTPIDEDHPKSPLNPYGASKWMIEQVLQHYDHAYQLRSICLRYFNAAGADPEGQLGSRHAVETHLIPLVLQAAKGTQPFIKVFGSDYKTSDGTCIRDYIHVQDLCKAHWLALQKLQQGATSASYNLGNGNGYSVREVIAMAQKITQQEIVVKYSERRPGDPASLVANAQRAREALGWTPDYPELETMMQHAWQWMLKQSQANSNKELSVSSY